MYVKIYPFWIAFSSSRVVHVPVRDRSWGECGHFLLRWVRCCFNCSSYVKHRMVDVLPVILKFWAILESRFSKVRQCFLNFLRFYSYLGVSYWIEAKSWLATFIAGTQQAIKKSTICLAWPTNFLSILRCWLHVHAVSL